MEENIVSSVKTTEAADGARLEQIAPEKPPVSGGRKAGLIVGIVVGVLALAYIAACVVVQFLYNDTALPHTDVLGVDVSGQAAQQIEALWEQQGERVLHDTAVTLTESGESIGAVTLEELAQKLALGRADPNGARDELLHTMACKSAIKAGMTTDATELAALVEKVQSGEILYCPHGRPVKYQLSKYDIEKMFKRA